VDPHFRMTDRTSDMLSHFHHAQALRNRFGSRIPGVIVKLHKLVVDLDEDNTERRQR
jgi:hypothetical protein